MKTIFMFGNRDLPSKVWRSIFDAVEEIIEESKGEPLRFIVGHRGRFDATVAVVLSALRAKYPQIKLLRLIAYYEPTKKRLLWEEYDDTYYPEGLETVSKRYAIVKANNLVVDSCDAVICYARREGSNAYKLMRRALRRNIPVVNLADHFPL